MHKLLGQDRLVIFLFLLLLCVIYITAYLGHGALPGNSPQYPLGWWGWFDQGHYINSARALSEADLSANKHLYPPLYAFLGSLFLPQLKSHPFFWVNIFSFLWCAYIFLHISRKYFSLWFSMLIFLLAILTDSIVLEQFVIPWTSTLAAALIYTGFYILEKAQNESFSESYLLKKIYLSFFFSFFLGLLVPLRPLDAVMALISIYPFYIWLTVKQCAVAGQRLRCQMIGIIKHLLALFLGGLFGVVAYLSFNYFVYESALGNYYSLASSNGYYPLDLLEKFISLFFDSESLYLEDESHLLARFPFLLVSLIGAVYYALFDRGLLKAIAVAAIVHLCLYLPYSDLIPNGLFRYKNIHYFKWMFPFLFLLGFVFIKDLFLDLINGKKRISKMIFLIMLLILACLGFSVERKEIVDLKADKFDGSSPIVFSVASAGHPLDAIDIVGLTGGFDQVYMGNHQLTVDGESKIVIKDFRLLPAAWGIRVLFVRPMKGQNFVLTPATGMVSESEKLKLFQVVATPALSISHMIGGTKKSANYYVFGTEINFSNSGKAHFYTGKGWSSPESWGTWTTGSRSSLNFLVQESHHNEAFSLVLSGRLFQSKQAAVVKVNGREIGRISGVDLVKHRMPISNELIDSKAGYLEVTFEINQPISPSDIGIGEDDRRLGLAVESLKIDVTSSSQ